MQTLCAATRADIAAQVLGQESSWTARRGQQLLRRRARAPTQHGIGHGGGGGSAESPPTWRGGVRTSSMIHESSYALCRALWEREGEWLRESVDAIDIRVIV